jgi:MFS family permease
VFGVNSKPASGWVRAVGWGYGSAMPAAEAASRQVARWRVRRLAAARVVSSGGTQAAQIALVYEIYALTRSGLWVAATLFGSISLGGLLGPISGWVADHFDRRRVMVVSEAAAGGVYLSMVFVHAPGLLLAGALVATVVGSPFRAASAASIPNLVTAQDLPWANAQLGAAANIALVAGPVVGGALVAVSGAGLVFAVNAVTFAVSAVLIALTGGTFGGHQRAGADSGSRRAMLAGFRFLVGNRRLAPLAAASALAYASFGAALVIDPALARYFHAGSVGYGLLTAVWGAGAVIGAVVAGRTVSLPRAPWAVVWGMAAMAVSLGSIAVLPNFTLIVAAGTIGGVGSGFVFVPWLLLIQHHSSDTIRGRVVAAAETFDQIAFLGGMGAAVAAISITNPHQAYALAGILLVAATLLAAGANAARPVVGQGTDEAART